MGQCVCESGRVWYGPLMQSQSLWAPWRMAYLRDLERRAEGVGNVADQPPGSFLERYWQSPADDAANFVVERSVEGMILLNRYPYANGHLLVALGDPRPALGDYEPPQRAAFWQLVDRAAALMQKALNPQGINIGVNQGSAAGAGVPEHLHGHLVPRWSGDTNFITTVGQVRVIPDALESVYEAYCAAR